MPLLDEWGVASRLASRSGFPGCFEGSVTQLAERWLQALSQEGLAEVGIFARGPTALLEGVGELAQRYGVPVQGENCETDHP
jgi:dihydroorotate dehydrogenase electron transfer subunit